MSGQGDGVRFGVLGPVAVTGDAAGRDDWVPVAGRSGLALGLLVEAYPRAVSIDRLLEEVWPDAGGTRATLQVLVHRVRRRVGADRVVLEPAGYRLAAEPDEIDAVAFSAAVRAVREELPADPEVALVRAEDALALWRGAPYSGWGAENETLAVASAGLEELRAEAVEARFEAALALGRAADLVGELRAAVAHAPLRERLQGQLMVALYRSGRTAEALDTFRAARATLVEELGIEPGPALRDLERAILTEDPDLTAAPAPLAAQRAPTRPVQLPPVDPAFVGRDTQLADLRAALETGAAVVAIDGPGGVGKSALALQVAHAVAGSYPGGVLYVNLHGATPGATPRDPHDVLERFARALGHDPWPDDLDEASAEFRSATSAQPVLVVLDDAATAAQVRPLLPGAGSAALVTSRTVLTALAPDAVHLDVLDAAHGLAILDRLAGRPRLAREPEAASGVVAACGGLPLALRIVGARLAAAPRRSLAAMLERLEDSRARLDELEADDLAVRSSLAVGLDVVHPEAAGLFALLGVVALPHVSAVAAARLADLPLGVARRRLDDLATAQLLAVDDDERYTMHDLVRLVAVERAAALPHAERDAALGRLYAHYRACILNARHAAGGPQWPVRESIGPCVDADGALVAFADGSAAAEWLRAELGAIVALAGALRASGGSEPEARDAVAALAAPLFHLLRTQGMHLAAAPLYAAYAGEDGAVVVPVRPTRGDAVLLVDASAFATDPAQKEALCRAGLEVARELADPELLANALNAWGVTLERAERYDEALDVYAEAVEVCRAVPSLHDKVPVVQKNLSIVLGGLGRHEESIAVLEAALDERTDEAAERTWILADLAEAHRQAGNPEAALPLFVDAVAGLIEHGHTFQGALYAWNHANALRDVGRTQEEVARRRESLGIVVDLGLLSSEQADEIMAGAPPDDLDVFDSL